MKKFLSALLVVLMLASLSVCAFAANPSPTQNKDKADATIVEAEKDEAKAAKAVKESAAKDEDGEEAVAAIGALPADATDEMKADFEDLADALVDAKDALAAGDAAIPADIKADAAEGATVSASQPFRAVASSYPATITISVENPDDFVGMIVFMNGKWVKLNTVVNDDGTVTFVLDEPAVLSIVSQVAKAA